MGERKMVAGSSLRLSTSRAFGALMVAVLMVHCLSDAAPIGVETLEDAADAEFDNAELGEAAELAVGESDTETVGEMSDYAATIKKVEEDLKKKKDEAKKKFDENMKKASATFAKLYAPIKDGPAPALDSPLGTDGQSGVSSMAQWAFGAKVEAMSTIAHKKIEKMEKELEENRYRHFSTAVCKEVLQSNVPAIGDLKFNAERDRIDHELKHQKAELKRKIAYDRADMGHKIASFKLWEKDSSWEADGGLTGPDPDLTHMMTSGQSNKMGASRVGELVQAAHWAFARQKAHAIESYSRNRKELKEQMKKSTEAHDLTLCRTGRKPENPQLRYELKKAKGALKQELTNMPADAVKAAEEKEKEKKEEEGEKQADAEGPGEEYGDLGEAGPGMSNSLDLPEAGRS